MYQPSLCSSRKISICQKNKLKGVIYPVLTGENAFEL
jgi:hypothetical protein